MAIVCNQDSLVELTLVEAQVMIGTRRLACWAEAHVDPSDETRPSGIVCLKLVEAKDFFVCQPLTDQLNIQSINDERFFIYFY